VFRSERTRSGAMPTHRSERTPWYASIVTRITLVFALLLVGVVVLMGWISWRASRTELIAQAHRAMDHTLDMAANRLQNVDRTLRENLDMLVTNPAMEEWCAQADTMDPEARRSSRDRVAAFIDPVIRSRTRFAQVRLIDADPAGMEVVRFDRSGREVQEVPDSLLQPKGDRGYYRATMAAGEGARLSFPIDLNQEHGALQRPFVPTLRMSAPLFSPRGKRAGMVIINADMRMLFAELLSMADSGRVLVLARADGEVLLHPDTALTFRFELGGTKKMTEVLPTRAVASAGDEVLVGHRAITIGPSNDGYTLAITQPMSGLLDALRRKRNGLTMLFAAIALGAIALMALFAYGVRERLNRLTGLMERYAVGSLEELPTGRRDEFGRMTRGLRTMQERIDARVRELEAARSAAEASDRQRRDLLANMSHEVRTPLNAIIGMSEGVDTAGLGQDDRDRMAIVRRSAQRLKGLVDDLLTHARIGEGKLALHYSSVDVRTLVQDIVQAHLPAARAKDLQMRTALGGLPAAVPTDALRLHQIIDNLVGNAVRFTVRGEVVIEAGVADGKTLRIMVSDTGTGIPAEEQQRIFERFERATSSEQEHGAGLGLAITKRMVDLLGGSIELESGKGQGSRFTVRLPLTTAPEAAPAPAAAPDTRGLRILYVEDVATNRMLVQEWAARWGWKLTVTETGEDAMAACERERFDLLLIDLGLGHGISGLELARRLRSAGPHRHTPMIALTAYAEDGEDEEALKAGMNDRVTKPVDRDSLLRTVAFWCDRSGPEQEAPDLGALAKQYDGDAERLRVVHAQYRSEFIQRRLALRSALRRRDEKALSDARHALRPHWRLLRLDGPVAKLDALTTLSGEQEMALLEYAFRACDRAFLSALREPVTTA
jgi:signal transduction histidine kinase/DNA-binding response OmpR family regulator